ncbi:MAG: hypothetical protein AAF799_17505 [Myxococcota bacterium]
MTTQAATLELSQALAVELHGLFRALDLRIQAPDLVRDKMEAAGRMLDELLEAEWNLLPESVAESMDRVAELIRDWSPDDSEAWAELKSQLREAYAGFASALHQQQVQVPELRPANYTRSVFHMGSAVLCLGLVTLLDARQLPWVAGAFAVWGWSMETVRRFSPWANRILMAAFRPIAHEQERNRINSATYYVTALLLLSLTGSPLLCAVAVAVLGFGDPLAGLAGRRWGRIRLVNGRSLEGTLVFFAVGTVTAVGAMQLVEHSLTGSQMWIVAAAAAVSGGLAELFSRRIDDNLSIPMASGIAAVVALLLMGLSPWG